MHGRPRRARRSTWRRAPAGRDFMVSDYSEAGQEGWLSDTRIDLLRGTGRIAGHGVIDVNGRRYTAEHILIAMGSSPVTPPVPGLRELEGVWSTRGGDQHESRPAAPLVLGAALPTWSLQRRSVVLAARRRSPRLPIVCSLASRRGWERISARR